MGLDAALQRMDTADLACNSMRSELRLFSSTSGRHVFVTDGSRVYDLTSAEAALLEEAAAMEDGPRARHILHDLGLSMAHGYRHIDMTPIEPPKVTAFSINVAQACNMGCHYCYADEGRFGTRARLMRADVAIASVDRLFAESDPNDRLVLGFMGGEPLLARRVVHDTARYAWEKAARSGREIGFSLTTNATLISEADAELFHELPFALTFSIDGARDVQRALRPMHDGGDSYQAVLDALAVIAKVGRPRQLSARATVTLKSGRLLPILDHLIGLGFDDVGFSALLVSPTPGLAFDEEDFKRHLEHMVACGEKAVAEIKAGRPYPFGNLETALQEIHRGSHRSLPCGAGAGYLSVNAEGALYACHRLIDDAAFAMGDVFSGSDIEARKAHLNRSHVDLMEPCKSCWARYLCGGGCHHEVKARGRLACDYIRGWLEFCLKTYVELSSAGLGPHERMVSGPEPSPLG